MVDMAAITGAASALKTAYELSKVALKAHDGAVMRAKITEMQGEISSALASAITAQTDQLALLKRVDDLEKKLTDRKALDRELRRYEQVQLPPGVWVRRIKQGAAKPGESTPDICCTCFERGKRSPLHASEPCLGVHELACNECGSVLKVGIRREPPLPRSYKKGGGRGGPNSWMSG